MKTIVIIENQAVELKALVSLFEQWQKEINVITAVEEKAAINIMAQQHVDLVVCDLAMPHGGTFEKFSLLTHTLPYIPCIALSPDEKNKDDLVKLGATHCLSKPIDNIELLQYAGVLLDAGTSGIVQGIPIHSFLQMLESEEKTCTLQISKNNEKGLLYVQNGELVGAETKHFVGEEAAYQILGWQETMVRIRHYNGQRKRQISKPLISIIMEAFRLRTERDKNNGESFVEKHQLPLKHLPVGGKKLPLEIGSRLKLEFPHLETMMETTMVGMIPDGCLIVTNPQPYENFEEMIGTEQRILIKYASKGRIWMFKVPLIKSVDAPSPMLFFEYPGVIHYHELRQNKRTPIFVPCTFHVPGEFEAYGNLVDMSISGAMFQFSHKNLEAAPKIDINKEVFIRCLLPGVKEEQKIDGAVRNLTIDTTETRIGVQFSNLQPYLNDKIGRYVSSVDDQ